MKLQRNCAIYTVVFIVANIVLQVSGADFGEATSENVFNTTIGRILIGPLAVLICIPILISMLSMIWDILKNKKWLWLFCSVFFAFGTTTLYYFTVYKKNEAT